MPGLPENSLEALTEVRRQEVAGVEFDIQITKDGEAILYHDTKLGSYLLDKEGESKCPRGQKINKLNYREIKSKCFLENGEELPSLSEALRALDGFDGHVFLDLKKKASENFYETIENSWLRDHPLVTYISFKKRALRPLKRRWPDAKRILLSCYIPRGLFYEGIGFNKRLSLFTKLFDKLGKNIALWTLNSKESLEEAIAKNADFLITDEYQKCVELVERAQ